MVLSQEIYHYFVDSDIFINSIANARSQPGTGTVEQFGPTGVTVVGQVPDYRTVSDEELRNPSPEDWLMIREQPSGMELQRA